MFSFETVIQCLRLIISRYRGGLLSLAEACKRQHWRGDKIPCRCYRCYSYLLYGYRMIVVIISHDYRNVLLCVTIISTLRYSSHH